MTASSTGTATNFEDLFTQIVNFLTTDADLVAASQQWTALYTHRDNLAGLLTNLTERTPVQDRKVIHGCRWEPRSINIDATNSDENHVRVSGATAGTSFIRYELRTATEIAEVAVRASRSNVSLFRNFTLEYSDDDSSWTTALTVSSNPSYSVDETKTFAVGGSPGAHIYWRITFDTVDSSTIYWRSLLLLDGSGDIANHFGSEVIFRAPGNSGTDEIYTGIRSEYDSAQGWYNLFLNGYTGYTSDNDFFEQPGGLYGFDQEASASNMCCVPMVPCWDSAMDYWFAASGRSFRFGVKVSTSFEGGYLGFAVPYATPNQYPYPLVVGGSMVPNEAARGVEWRYSYNNYFHSVFPIPCKTFENSLRDEATLYYRTPDGEWRSCGNRTTSTNPDAIARFTRTAAIPHQVSGGPAAGMLPAGNFLVSAGSPNGLPYRELLNGGYVIRPLIILQRLPSNRVIGELEGCYDISGFDNASENTTVYNGITHVIFQNAARTETQEYWALALP